MQTFQPKKVEPGFQLRWAKQTLDLVVRYPFFWIFYLFSLFLLGEIITKVYFKIPFGILINLIGINAIALIDNNKFNFNNIYLKIEEIFQDLYLEFYYKYLTYIVIFTALFFLEIYIPDGKNKSLDNFIFIFHSSFFLFFLGFISIGPGASFYFHLFRKNFNIEDKKLIFFYCFKGMRLNKDVLNFFQIYTFVCLFLISYIFPILIIVLCPLSIGYVYMSFREIFLNKSDNSKVTETSKEIVSNILTN